MEIGDYFRIHFIDYIDYVNWYSDKLKIERLDNDGSLKVLNYDEYLDDEVILFCNEKNYNSKFDYFCLYDCGKYVLCGKDRHFGIFEFIKEEDFQKINNPQILDLFLQKLVVSDEKITKQNSDKNAKQNSDKTQKYFILSNNPFFSNLDNF